MEECIVFELKNCNKFCKIVSLYRSPNQSRNEFETFTNNLQLTLDKIFETKQFLVIALGDVNATLSQRYKNDKTITEGPKITNLTSQYGLNKLQTNLLTYLTTRLLALIYFSHRNLI